MTIVSDTSAPLVVVGGSTGTQGGSVVTALEQSDKPYRIRGLTRDGSKPAAQKLKQRGVEPFTVDISVGNEDSVAKAVEGAAYVFMITDFWAHMSLEREVAEGKMVVDAVKKEGATFLWSGLDSYKAISGGKYPNVDHFEGKYDITQYAKEQGVPTIVILPGFYASNLTTPAFGPRKQDDGSYVFGTVYEADNKLPLLDTVADYGLFVRAAIEHHKPGDRLEAFSEIVTIGDMIKQLAEVTGKNVAYHHITDEQLLDGLKASGSPPAMQAEVSEMFFFQREFGYYGDRDIEQSHKHLARPTTTWREFVKSADWSQVLN